MRRIAILTAGADSPGQNAAIRAVARNAFQHSYEVFGVKSGFKGLEELFLVLPSVTPSKKRTKSIISNKSCRNSASPH